MSLREEIVLILQRYKREIDHSAYRTPTEEILSKFEKRIDSIKPESFFAAEYYDGFAIALEKVKEILK